MDTKAHGRFSEIGSYIKTDLVRECGGGAFLTLDYWASEEEFKVIARRTCRVERLDKEF